MNPKTLIQSYIFRAAIRPWRRRGYSVTLTGPTKYPEEQTEQRTWRAIK